MYHPESSSKGDEDIDKMLVFNPAPVGILSIHVAYSFLANSEKHTPQCCSVYTDVMRNKLRYIVYCNCLLEINSVFYLLSVSIEASIHSGAPPWLMLSSFLRFAEYIYVNGSPSLINKALLMPNNSVLIREVSFKRETTVLFSALFSRAVTS